MPTRVAVFDNHPVVHRGLTSLLPKHGFIVVCQSTDANQATKKISESSADVVITDPNLPGKDGLAVLESIYESELTVKPLVYSDRDDPTLVARSIVWGANDFVLKTDPIDHLIRGLKNCLLDSSKPQVQSELFQHTKKRMRRQRLPSEENPFGLTHREIQVFTHLGFGLSNQEIALSLGVGVETAKEYVQNVMRKQNFNDRTQAAVAAIRNGLA